MSTSTVLAAETDLPGPQAPARPAGPVAAVPEQIRVCVHVGNYFIDTSLSAHTPLSVVMEGLLPFLVDTLRAEGLAVDFAPHGVYSLAVEGGMAFARSATLAESGVLDGARLLLQEVRSTEVFRPIIEDGSDALAEYTAAKFPAFTAATARTVGLVAAVAGAALIAALLITAWWSTPDLVWWLPPAALATVVAGSGSAVAARRRGSAPVAYALGLAAVALAFGAGWVAVPPADGVPGRWTAANVLAAVVAAGVISLLVAWLTRVGITVHTGVVALAAAAAVVAGLTVFTGLDARQLGVGALLAGMTLTAAAPACALWLARVRPSSLPPPGEKIDRNELEEAALVVEVFDDTGDTRTVALSEDPEDQMIEAGQRLANKFLTGMFVAAAAITVAGAVAALHPGTHYYGGEVAIAGIAVLVLALRGRSLTDRVQTIGFYVASFVLLCGLTLVVVGAAGGPAPALGVIAAVMAATVAACAAGLLLPGRKLSPIVLRRIEQLESALIVALVPLAFWVSGAFSALRNLL
jgi:type VII secretion integral membrane protein EccD